MDNSQKKGGSMYENKIENMKSAVQVDRAPQVVTQIQSLKQIGEEIQMRTATLMARLDGVLKPVVPAPGGLAGDRPPQEPLCLLAEAIAQLCNEFRCVNNQLGDLLSRLEV